MAISPLSLPKTGTDVYKRQVMNTDPELFDKLGIEEKDGKLIVPVTHIIPAYLMGSGLGSATLMSGDYDITTQDKEAVKELGLDTLRFGDIVYIQDNDGHNGAHYLKGSGSVGVIVHSDSFTSGHGPGAVSYTHLDVYKRQALLHNSQPS